MSFNGILMDSNFWNLLQSSSKALVKALPLRVYYTLKDRDDVDLLKRTSQPDVD